MAINFQSINVETIDGYNYAQYSPVIAWLTSQLPSQPSSAKSHPNGAYSWVPYRTPNDSDIVDELLQLQVTIELYGQVASETIERTDNIIPFINVHSLVEREIEEQVNITSIALRVM